MANEGVTAFNVLSAVQMSVNSVIDDIHLKPPIITQELASKSKYII